MGVSFISHQQEEMLAYLMKENEELRRQKEVLIEQNQQLLISAIEGNADKVCENIIHFLHEEMEAIQKSNENIDHLRQSLENYKNLSEKQLNDRIVMLQHDIQEKGMDIHQTIEENIERVVSEVAQDSRQLLDIQRAINDLWEIMKVVWVDSLLDGYDVSGDATPDLVVSTV